MSTWNALGSSGYYFNYVNFNQLSFCIYECGITFSVASHFRGIALQVKHSDAEILLSKSSEITVAQSRRKPNYMNKQQVYKWSPMGIGAKKGESLIHQALIMNVSSVCQSCRIKQHLCKYYLLCLYQEALSDPSWKMWTVVLSSQHGTGRSRWRIILNEWMDDLNNYIFSSFNWSIWNSRQRLKYRSNSV